MRLQASSSSHTPQLEQRVSGSQATFDLQRLYARCCFVRENCAATARSAIVDGRPHGRRPQHRRPAVAAANHSGAARATQRNRTPPVRAPASIARTEISRRARTDGGVVSATRPVTVKVSTVVVRSGTARRRTTAFWPPMATASNPISVSRTAELCAPAVLAMTDATRTTPA